MFHVYTFMSYNYNVPFEEKEANAYVSIKVIAFPVAKSRELVIKCLQHVLEHHGLPMMRI